MHTQRHCLYSSFIPFSSRPVKPGHAAKRRVLSVSAAQADVIVKEKRGDCQCFHIFNISQLCSVLVCSGPHMLGSCILTFVRHSKPMQRRSVNITCCAVRQGSKEAVLVVGAGIAGLASAAALHKVLAALHFEDILHAKL